MRELVVVDPPSPRTDDAPELREFLLVVRRALLMIVAYIDRKCAGPVHDSH